MRSFNDAHACRATALLPRNSPFHASSLSLHLFFSSDTFTSHVSTVRSKSELAATPPTHAIVYAVLSITTAAGNVRGGAPRSSASFRGDAVRLTRRAPAICQPDVVARARERQQNVRKKRFGHVAAERVV